MALSRSYEWDSEIRQREFLYLSQVAARSGDAVGYVPHVELLDGHVADAIHGAAREHEAPLIVMTSHGLTGFSRYWIGSTTDAVIRQAHTPVVMVRARDAGDAPPSSTIHRILVPLDGSRIAEAILPHALSIAKATGATLELYRVVEPTHVSDVTWVPETSQSDDESFREAEAELRTTVDRLGGDAAGCRIETNAVVAVSPATTIATHARARDCELVAMTTTASGLARLVGSVADKVIRHGPPMVLLVRPEAAGS
jgi:nucleotide-binding universal stress UspA family protein